MKTNNIIYLPSLVLIMLVCLFGCESMNDIHQEYIENGETIYAPRVYNIEAQPGNGRLMFKMYFINGLNITQNIIEWSEGKNSVKTPTAFNAWVDSMQVEIKDLQEKSYIFDVYNLDKEDNRSIKVQVIGTVYGPIYQSTLLNRVISSMAKTDTALVITWATPKEGENGVKLEYPDGNGTPSEYRVKPDELKTYIKSWQANGILKFSTYYLPAENAVDEFLSNSETKILP